MKSLDVVTIKAVSKVIDIQCQSHVIGSEYHLIGFYERSGISLSPEWKSLFTRDMNAVFKVMRALNGTDEFKKVLLRLASPLEYGGDRFAHQETVRLLNEILRAEELEIALNGSTPLLRAIEVLDLEDPEIELTTEEVLIRRVGEDVFVVHGHDTGAKDSVVRFLSDLGLNPIILQEIPGQGRAIINKFEDHANEAGFAVALFTPDDEGAPAGGTNIPQPRARQNVIFELGFFIGKLGRNKVSVLYKGDVEIPSDYAGVEYISFDDAGSWKLKLIGELQSAGFDVDANQATRR